MQHKFTDEYLTDTRLNYAAIGVLAIMRSDVADGSVKADYRWPTYTILLAQGPETARIKEGRAALKKLLSAGYLEADGDDHVVLVVR